MSELITIEFVANIPKKDLEKATRIVHVAMEFATKYLKAQGVDVVVSSATRRRMTKEEKIERIPPRKHYGTIIGALCGKGSASKSNLARSRHLTSDWSKVDCKMCLKLRPATPQSSMLF